MTQAKNGDDERSSVPKTFLRHMAQTVRSSDIRRIAKQSADHDRYKWDYVDALIQPLQTGRFPEVRVGELNFILGNLLTALDGDPKVKPANCLYLASLYLYVRQTNPQAMQLSETAIRLALHSIVNSKSPTQFELFWRFLDWLLEVSAARRDADSYFVRLGAGIAKAQMDGGKRLNVDEIERSLPSWVRGAKDVRLLTDDAKFPHSWKPLLTHFETSRDIKRLLGQKS